MLAKVYSYYNFYKTAFNIILSVPVASMIYMYK